MAGFAKLVKESSVVNHKFNIGDKVVFTNDFGVCWGVKTISAQDERNGVPTYHYEGSETPWFSVSEQNFVKATPEDIQAQARGDDHYFQTTHGFQPTLDQLGGCY